MRREIQTKSHPRSSVARQEKSVPLDKDLSWKSASRTNTGLVPDMDGKGVTHEFPYNAGIYGVFTVRLVKAVK